MQNHDQTQMNSLTKSIAYGTLHLLTAGRGVKRQISGETFRFPARWCRYHCADYEPETFTFLRSHCQEGQTALDIGAHLGLFTVFMARLVGPSGRIFSFEPTPVTNEVLREVVRLNGCNNTVEVRSEAVARTAGTAVFYDTGNVASNANSLIQTSRSESGISVKTISIDEIVQEKGLSSVNCLKIDAEGAELDVLLGAAHTLEVHRPVIALSLHPYALQQAGGSLADIWRILQKYRLSVVELDKYKTTAHAVNYRLNDTIDERLFCQQDDLFDAHIIPLP